MSHIQIFSGRPADAIKTIEANMRLDPVYPEITLYFLAEARFSLGEYDQAVAALKLRLERNPELGDFLRPARFMLWPSRAGFRGPGGVGANVEDRLRFLDRAPAPNFAV